MRANTQPLLEQIDLLSALSSSLTNVTNHLTNLEQSLSMMCGPLATSDTPAAVPGAPAVKSMPTPSTACNDLSLLLPLIISLLLAVCVILVCATGTALLYYCTTVLHY